MRLHATRRAAIAQARGLGNPLWDLAGVSPSLDQRFAESKSLIDAVSGQQLITFSRASGGTFVNSAGLIETAAENVPRFTHDPVTLESLGLLVEEQRVQLLELTDALATQTKIVAAVAHTLSFYGTGTVALSGVHTATVVGTGAYPARTTLTFTPTAGSLTLTVTGTVQFGQLEAGSFATSYIPNAGTGQVTRSADVASITGANFSSWYRQDEGTVFVSALTNQSHGGSNGFPRTLSISNGTNNNLIEQYYRVLSSYTDTGYLISSLGVSQAAFDSNNQRNGQIAAIGYASNNFALVVGGSALDADTLGTVPTVNQLILGARLGSNNLLNGTIRRLVYWGQRLPNSTLQNITL